MKQIPDGNGRKIKYGDMKRLNIVPIQPTMLIPISTTFKIFCPIVIINTYYGSNQILQQAEATQLFHDCKQNQNA